MNDPSPAYSLALRVVQTLQTNGHEAYFAGGCVRDRLLEIAPQDYDVATSALPPAVQSLFPRSLAVGVSFGVVLVRVKQHSVAVATFRRDAAYSDGRHPESVQFATAEVDAQRRDFTCNGLFFDPVADRILDFVDGQRDIKARVLRAIGNPDERFAEDHLRMLRATRFATRLGFTIERATLAAIRHNAPKLSSISRERVGDEMRRMLAHPARHATMQLLESCCLLPAIWPEGLPLPAHRNMATLQRLPKEAGFVVALAAVLVDTTGTTPARRDAFALLRTALALSNQELADAQWLLEKLAVLREFQTMKLAALKRLLADPRWPDLRVLFAAAHPEHAAEMDERERQLRLDPIGAPPLVNGDDLIALGAKPGAAFRQWLDTLYDMQLENAFADKAAALNAARVLLAQAK